MLVIFINLTRSWWRCVRRVFLKVGLCLLSPNHEECLLRSHQERWVGGWGPLDDLEAAEIRKCHRVSKWLYIYNIYIYDDTYIYIYDIYIYIYDDIYIYISYISAADDGMVCYFQLGTDIILIRINAGGRWISGLHRFKQIRGPGFVALRNAFRFLSIFWDPQALSIQVEK